MKTRRLSASLLLLPTICWLSTSCGKDPGPVDENLLGRWQLTQQIGGIAGMHRTPDPAHPESIEFDKKGYVFQYKDNVQVEKKAYHLVTSSNSSANITIEGDFPQEYSIHGDSLVLREVEISDGFTYYYCRTCAGVNKTK